VGGVLEGWLVALGRAPRPRSGCSRGSRTRPARPGRRPSLHNHPGRSPPGPRTGVGRGPKATNQDVGSRFPALLEVPVLPARGKVLSGKPWKAEAAVPLVITPAIPGGWVSDRRRRFTCPVTTGVIFFTTARWSGRRRRRPPGGRSGFPRWQRWHTRFACSIGVRIVPPGRTPARCCRRRTTCRSDRPSDLLHGASGGPPGCRPDRRLTGQVNPGQFALAEAAAVSSMGWGPVPFGGTGRRRDTQGCRSSSRRTWSVPREG